MRHNLTALLLALAMMLSLSACGGKQKEESASEDVTAEAPAQLPEEQENVEEETEEVEENEPADEEPVEEEPVEENTAESQPEETPEVKPEEKPAEAPKPQPAPQQPAPAPETPAPAPEQPAPAPEAAAGKDLAAFYQTISATENWPMMMQAEGEMLDAFYPGLNEIATKQCMVQMAAISAAACEVALVEVENEADVEAVKGIFQSRIQYQVGDETTPGGAWYPETIERWEKNSRVVSNGNCVMLIVWDDADGVAAQFGSL